MDYSKRFCEDLAIQYPGLGRALWVPDPGGLYNAVQVGHVGFIRHGYFTCIFNALSPRDRPSDDPTELDPHYPDYIQPLQPRRSNHIRRSIDPRKDFRSKYVTIMSREPNTDAVGPDDDTQFTFSCSGRQGALLYLPFPAELEDTVAQGDFREWIINNIHDCMRFAEEEGLGVNRMEDIILVTGRHLARSWVRAIFSDSRGGAQVTFVARVSGASDVHLEERNVSGAQSELGPSGESLPNNQCLFVQGYRVVRILNIWPRLRGLAGPAPDLHEPEPESDTHIRLMSVPADDDDPLHTLLGYIAEQNPTCDMAVVHDDDLKCIENAIPPLSTLQPDELMGFLRNHVPEIRLFQCESSFSGNKNESGAKVVAATVATLSQNVSEAPLDKGTISSPVSTHKTTRVTGALQGVTSGGGHEQPRDLLCTDSYIARMLGAADAPRYFSHLVHVDEHTFQLVVLNEIFWLLYPAVKGVHPTTQINDRPAWLLDYVVRNVGTVVPQRLWTPASLSDAQHYGTTPLNMPIFFVKKDGVTLGLPLDQAAVGNCHALLNAHGPAPIGQCHTIIIRIMWPGYNEWNCKIMTRDQTPAHNTIPLEALASRIARAVSRFLQDCGGQQCMSPSWLAGRGGITADDIIFIGLLQVTQGSWQPILQLNRFILPQSSSKW